jgi:hypothetical protein
MIGFLLAGWATGEPIVDVLYVAYTKVLNSFLLYLNHHFLGSK